MNWYTIEQIGRDRQADVRADVAAARLRGSSFRGFAAYRRSLVTWFQSAFSANAEPPFPNRVRVDLARPTDDVCCPDAACCG